MTAEKTLIEAFIEEQQRLTAVERFALQHDSNELLLPTARYRDLLPATPPAPGEQYAFEVNLDGCSGCKACVTACHSLNGLDEGETWREVGLLIEAPRKRRSRVGVEVTGLTTQSVLTSVPPSVQHVTTACHHCVDPACLNGCPVLAYDKDPITGIVRHLDDQCIGCQYCVLKCPYDVPKYNARLGIVRKCDLCANRLSAGEAPACAQACPNEAIRVTKVQTETVAIAFRDRATTFLTGAPAGDYTLPTTRFIGAITAETGSATAQGHAAAGALVAADDAAVKPQGAHAPLLIMLVLTQWSVGACIASAFAPALRYGAMVTVVIGLGVSALHLGRPMGAWRGFLNLRRSWMSREIVAFALYPAAIGAALCSSQLRMIAALAGLGGVWCSAMIYVDTRRELWRAERTFPLFLLTTTLLGAASALLLLPANVWFVGVLVASAGLKLAVEIGVIRHVTDRTLTPMRKTALLVTGRFQGLAMLRLATILLGGVGIPVLLSTNMLHPPQFWAATALSLLLVGELCERFLFFRCVVAPKMPGGLA